MSELPPNVGVVTVTFNSGTFLDEFVRSCASQTIENHRVYCVDNDSRDNTKEILAEQRDLRWRCTLNRENVGVAEGNNQGIVQALADGCEWILLLNNDTSFPPDFFAQLLAACARHEWGVVVPKIHYDQPSGHIWYGGGGFDARKGHTGYHTEIGKPDLAQCDRMGTVDYSPTCAMLIHRSVFRRVGLMDESYFVYFDDTDFCWRLRQASVQIGYWPGTVLIHKVGGSTGGKTSPFTARITSRNRLYFVRKHFGAVSAHLWSVVFMSYYVYRYLLRSWNPVCFKASVAGTLSYRSVEPRVPPVPHEG